MIFFVFLNFLFLKILRGDSVCDEQMLILELYQDLKDNGILDCKRSILPNHHGDETIEQHNTRVLGVWDTNCAFESLSEIWVKNLNDVYEVESLVDEYGNIVEQDFDDQADICEIVRACIAGGRFPAITKDVTEIPETILTLIDCPGDSEQSEICAVTGGSYFMNHTWHILLDGQGLSIQGDPRFLIKPDLTEYTMEKEVEPFIESFEETSIIQSDVVDCFTMEESGDYDALKLGFDISKKSMVVIGTSVLSGKFDGLQQSSLQSFFTVNGKSIEHVFNGNLPQTSIYSCVGGFINLMEEGQYNMSLSFKVDEKSKISPAQIDTDNHNIGFMVLDGKLDIFELKQQNIKEKYLFDAKFHQLIDSKMDLQYDTETAQVPVLFLYSVYGTLDDEDIYAIKIMPFLNDDDLYGSVSVSNGEFVNIINWAIGTCHGNNKKNQFGLKYSLISGNHCQQFYIEQNHDKEDEVKGLKVSWKALELPSLSKIHIKRLEMKELIITNTVGLWKPLGGPMLFSSHIAGNFMVFYTVSFLNQMECEFHIQVMIDQEKQNNIDFKPLRNGQSQKLISLVGSGFIQLRSGDHKIQLEYMSDTDFKVNEREYTVAINAIQIP